MSEHLKAFLTAWIEWVDAGAPEGDPFSRHEGLCLNVFDCPAIEPIGRGRVCRALEDQFAHDGLDGNHPFGGHAQYTAERQNAAHHLNPARIAWVRSKVAQYEVV